MSDQRHNPPERGGIAVIGAGPAGLLAAIALARRGIRTTVLERQDHPQVSPRFDPERSYTIDITGHGHRALQHIDATAYFDARLLAFRGIQHGGRVVEEWRAPGWTSSRGDILRAHVMVAARRPCFDTATAVSAAASEFRSTQATSAPASARASAISLPSPPPAPVTRATLPARSNSWGRDTEPPGGRGQPR